MNKNDVNSMEPSARWLALMVHDAKKLIVDKVHRNLL